MREKLKENHQKRLNNLILLYFEPYVRGSAYDRKIIYPVKKIKQCLNDFKPCLTNISGFEPILTKI